MCIFLPEVDLIYSLLFSDNKCCCPQCHNKTFSLNRKQYVISLRISESGQQYCNIKVNLSFNVCDMHKPCYYLLKTLLNTPKVNLRVITVALRSV